MPRNFNALPPDEQWQEIEEIHQKISSNPDTAGLLGEAWDEIEHLFYYGESPLVPRGKGESQSRPPLARMFELLEIGCYPPPELLLGLLATWKAFVSNSDAVDLETAFLGRRRQRAGGYSKQRGEDMTSLRIYMEFLSQLHQGRSRAEAAEAVALCDFAQHLDADTILRRMRGVSPNTPKMRRK
jgi:hypothetical protein